MHMCTHIVLKEQLVSKFSRLSEVHINCCEKSQRFVVINKPI